MSGVAPPPAVTSCFASTVPAPIAKFLAQPTPRAWLEHAVTELDTLLLDHANCEKKAASTALSTLYRYPDRPQLVYRMSRLAREELRHFEQVNAIIEQRGIRYRRVEASRYAGRLRALVASHEPERLRDTLICGAFIEARSCERFAALVPLLEPDLARFYTGLLSSEARHFEHYLALAKDVLARDFDARVSAFRACDAAAIAEPDDQFSFHSGHPSPALVSPPAGRPSPI